MSAIHRGMLALILGLVVARADAMDLLEAYDAALAEDANYAAARFAAESGSEAVPIARAQLMPNVSASVSRSRNHLDRTSESALGPVNTTETYPSRNASVSLRQPIYRKPLWVGLEQARQAVAESDALLDLSLQDLGVRVAGAYFETLLAREQVELARASVIQTEAQRDQARKALVAGVGTRTDIDAAQARLDMAIADALQARQNLDYSQRQLASITNRQSSNTMALDVSRMPLLPPNPSGIEEWIHRVEAGNPELRRLKFRTEAARLEIDKARGAHYPTLDAVAQWVSSNSENVVSTSVRYTNASVALQLTIPIYSGGLVNANVRRANAEFEKASSQTEALRRELGVRVYREFQGVTEGLERVRALEQSVRSAQLLLESSKKSFDAGARTRIDILNAERELAFASRDLAQARFQYLLARIRLQSLAGVDPRESLSEVNAWLVR